LTPSRASAAGASIQPQGVQARPTNTSYALLALVDQLGEATPYEIKQAMDSSIDNFWPVPHTTAYEEPARLASGGYMSVRQEEGGRRRKTYALTEEGRAALATWAEDTTWTPPQLRDEAILKVLEELQGYLEAVHGEEAWRRSELVLTACSRCSTSSSPPLSDPLPVRLLHSLGA
jgi:DNA-binding PadR family transcriptional regulator